MSSKREFKLLGAQGQVMGTYTGSCPYQAAMKAASREHSSIMLCEHYGNGNYGDKIHVYQGAMRRLENSEKTAFATRHKIKFKPDVVKIGTMKRHVRSMGNENDYDQAIKDQEDKCNEMPDDECTSPCEIHSNGTCYYPD